MIRFNITYDELKERIRKEDASWLDDAEKKTEEFQRLGKYSESSTIWRRVVRIYMRLQHNKCAFCERKLEAPESGGTREFDIEHFRPKSSVKAWPTNKIIRELNLPDDFPRSKGCDKGYYLLPYHPLNYTVACKPCNSSFKSNYFPIRGNRNVNADDPRNLQDEQAYLVYPVGDFDDDPETIVKYNGVIAVPVKKEGESYDRARVIIVFFDLNDREEYFSERAEKISHLFQSLENFHHPPTEMHRKLAERAVIHLISEKSSHSNCNRSFKYLYENNKDKAIKVVKEIIKYLRSGS